MEVVSGRSFGRGGWKGGGENLGGYFRIGSAMSPALRTPRPGYINQSRLVYFLEYSTLLLPLH